MKVPLEMFTEVKDHLSHGGNPNKENENGITLVRYTVESLEFVVVKQIFVDLVGHPKLRKLNPQQTMEHSKNLLILFLHKITTP